VRNWRRSIVAALCILAALTWTTTTEAQVADTIVVTIQGKIDQVILTAEFVTPPRVGDTVYFRAQVYDEDGDPATGFRFHWASEDPAVIKIEPLENGRARGIAMQKALEGVMVWVMVEPVGEIVTAQLLSDGSLNWERPFQLTALSQQMQLCAYMHRSGVLVAESPGPPVCPTVFLPEAMPAFWPGAPIQRAVPWNALMAMGSG